MGRYRKFRSRIVALGILGSILALFAVHLDQVQGAAQAPSAGGLPGLETRVSAIEKAFRAKVSTLEFRVSELENQLFDATQKLQFISVTGNTINGLRGPHLLITGVNVHIRSGSGQTVDATNLGNLIVGYNEPLFGVDGSGLVRSGSHNLIVGPFHDYTASGGFLAGHANQVSADSGSVTGGSDNAATGQGASVNGGFSNTASGLEASVSGGYLNTASGTRASVAGGSSNTASSALASVPGEAFIIPSVSPTTPVGLGLGGTPAVIAKGTLPAGDWLLFSLFLLARANGVGFPICVLRSASQTFEFNNSISIAGSSVRVELTGAASLAASTEVLMECSSATGGEANGLLLAVRMNRPS